VLDRAGRLQIPREMLDKLNIQANRVRMEMQGDRIIITGSQEETQRAAEEALEAAEN